MKRLAAILLTALVTMATPAMAHTSADAHGGFMHGLMHPIGGLDHVLAMVAVGVLAFQMGRRAVWVVPASFVVMMVVGGVLGFVGSDLPYTELGIAASVLVLGALLTLQIALPTLLIACIVGLFAVFHGYAHGVELPNDVTPQSFAIGFVIATSLLHGVGLVVGRAMATLPVIVTRVSGIAMMAAGVSMM